MLMGEQGGQEEEWGEERGVEVENRKWARVWVRIWASSKEREGTAAARSPRRSLEPSSCSARPVLTPPLPHYLYDGGWRDVSI